MKKILALAFAGILLAAAVCLALAVAGLVPFTPFAVKTWDTGLFARTDADSGALKVARYDIDFIASFQSEAGRYVAIYPFIVEAEVDLSRAVRKTAVRETAVRKNAGGEEEAVVSVPWPEYRAHLETDGVQVFMDTLALDYKSVLMPVLETFREKSRDYALADGAFAEQSLVKAEEYIESIFGPARIEWEMNADPVVRLGAPSVPLDIEATASALVSVREPASLRDAFDASVSRSDPGIETRLRAGIAGTETGTIEAFVRSFDRSGHIVFRYHNPVDPSSAVFVSYADEGYRRAFAYGAGSDKYYYVELAQNETGVNEEEHLRTAAGDLLYFAASLQPAPSQVPAAAGGESHLRYAEYVVRYGEALEEIRTGRYGKRLANALDELDRLALERTGEASADAALMREIAGFTSGTAVKAGSDAGSAGKRPSGAAGTEKTAELAALLRYPDFTRMDALFRSEAENRYRSNAELAGNLEAFFWMMRDELGLTAAEADRYKADLIGAGDVISRALVRTLSGTERNALFARYVQKRLPADIPSETVEPGDGSGETWIFFGQAALDWKDKKAFPKIADKLASRGHDRTKGTLVLLFADPVGKAGFLTDYHALVFGESSLALYEGITNLIPRYAKESLYAELLFADGSFTVERRTISGRPDLASILEGFADAYTSEFYNRDRALELVAEDLKNEALKALSRSERPSPGKGASEGGKQ